MRNTQPPVPRIATYLRRTPPAFVEWTAIMLILLTVTLCTFSGNFQSISLAVPQYTAGTTSFSSLAPGQGCYQADVPLTQKSNPADVLHDCDQLVSYPCQSFDIYIKSDGSCTPDLSASPNVGGCVRWWSSGWCAAWNGTMAPQCNNGSCQCPTGFNAQWGICITFIDTPNNSSSINNGSSTNNSSTNNSSTNNSSTNNSSTNNSSTNNSSTNNSSTNNSSTNNSSTNNSSTNNSSTNNSSTNNGSSSSNSSSNGITVTDTSTGGCTLPTNSGHVQAIRLGGGGGDFHTSLGITKSSGGSQS